MDAKTVEKQEARNPGGIEFFSFEADGRRYRDGAFVKRGKEEGGRGRKKEGRKERKKKLVATERN